MHELTPQTTSVGVEAGGAIGLVTGYASGITAPVEWPRSSAVGSLVSAISFPPSLKRA